MVISSHMPNSKSQKLNVEHDTNGSCTNIDYLPSTILHRILSLMPTKDAVRTSVLSKRWRNIWKSISNLDFEQKSPSERKLFLNFVERVLLLRDSLSVEKFSLSCSVLGDGSRINVWISAALKHNVQELCICLSAFEEPFVLPHCLFMCETLTMLEIQMHLLLRLPPSICLSRLKSLTLKHITFPGEHLTQQLFSGCPVLEELCIDSCCWLCIRVVSICAPNLRCLTISEVDEEEDQDDYRGCQVMIFGMSLEYFNYTGELANDYCLYNPSLLLGACIDVYQYGPIPREREVAYRAIKLLRGVSNVKNLHLTSECVRAFDDAKELFPHLPTFDNLTEFKVDGLMDFDCESVPNFLRTFPRLESVVFSQGICIYANRGIDFWSLDPVPSCFSTHLKFIKVDKFAGNKDELHLIKFFLENARVLNDMVICMSTGLAQDLEKQKTVKEQILNFPSASVCCSIVFEIER